MTALLESFLVVEQPRQRLSHWNEMLAPLDDPRAAPAQVIGYFDPELDQALIGLRYSNEQVAREGLALVAEIAVLAELAEIRPTELSDGDRRRFVNERLRRCAIHVMGRPGVVATLTDLVKRVREQGTTTLATSQPILGRIPLRAPGAGLMSRGDTADPVLLVQPKGTRDGLVAVRGTRDLPRPEPTPQPALRARSTRNDVTRAISPNLVRRSRVVTKEISPVAAYLKATESLGEPVSAAAHPRIVYARYLRGTRWMPLRIGSLSLKGATLLTGALPRLDDQVSIALAFEGHRVLVGGRVDRVSSKQEAAMTGTTTFSVTFEHDDSAREQLIALLASARAAKVTLKPPPARAARRFPVRWPLSLKTTSGLVRADALDVSRDGMFVRVAHPLTLGARLAFSTMLDDGERLVGRVRVVRHVDPEHARATGLEPGWGLQLDELDDVAGRRWLKFLARVEQRADRRVLIGAAPARLAELQALLAATGYAVLGGVDADTFVALASGGPDARTIDAALIDADWLSPPAAYDSFSSMFRDRQVPWLVHDGDVGRAARALDELLAVT